MAVGHPLIATHPHPLEQYFTPVSDVPTIPSTHLIYGTGKEAWPSR